LPAFTRQHFTGSTFTYIHVRLLLFLHAQVDQPDAGLTDQELAARLSYEEALARYRHALAERQQPQQAIEEAVHGVLGNQVEQARQPLNRQVQVQPQLELQRHELLQVHPQQHVAGDTHQQLQGELGQQQQHPAQQAVDAVPQHAAVEAVAAAEHEEQRVRERQRHNQRQQLQPRHWMAEHDADGGSPAAAGGVLDGASSSSSSEGSGGGTSSDEEDDPDSLVARRNDHHHHH
jgi:hypothetical protein